MGLDTSHDCWHGPYSAFMRWRTRLCDLAGYGNYLDYFTPEERAHRDKDPRPAKPIPNDDPLWALLAHSDCDGEIAPELCGPLADRLQELVDTKMPARATYDDIRPATERFIKGLREAAAVGEAVEFG